MLNIKTFKKELTMGIVISVIMLFFVQPIITNIWNWMSKKTDSFYSDYIDSAYHNAALGQRNWLDFITLQLFLVVIFFTLSAYFLKIRLEIEKNIHENKLKSIKNDSEKKELIVKHLNSNTYKIGGFVSKHLNKFRISTYFVQLLVFLLTFHLIFITYVDLQLNASFKQRLAVLAPYISEEEEELFEAKWALMKNRKDNREINKTMDKIATEMKVKLPELLLK
jgi:hypothetical protein